MPVAVQLSEKTSYPYIFVDSKNRVHLLVPISSGEEIALDNTCQATQEIRQFFGVEIDADDKQRSAAHVLSQYKSDLIGDIELIESLLKTPHFAVNGPIKGADFEKNKETLNSILVLKQKRLEQINTLHIQLAELQVRPEFSTEITHVYSEYPRSISEIMRQRSNGFSMLLAPDPNQMDPLTRYSAPVFSLGRGMLVHTGGSRFRIKFRGYFQAKELHATSAKSNIVQLFSKTDLVEPEQFDAIAKRIQEEVAKLMKVSSVPLELKDGELTWEYFEDTLMVVDSETTIAACAEAILGAAFPDLDQSLEADLFTQALSLPEKDQRIERLSILTQFLFAIINFHCFITEKSTKNFGQVLDHEDKTALRRTFNEAIHGAITNGQDVVEEVIYTVNLCKDQFGLSEPLNEEDAIIIKQKLGLFATVAEAPHFDEFFVYYPRSGDFTTHQGRICLSFDQVFSVAKGKGVEKEDLFDRPLPHQNSSVAVTLNISQHFIIKLKNENSYQLLASLLALQSGPSSWVFAEIVDKVQSSIMAFDNWDRCRAEMVNLLPTPGAIEAFNERYSMGCHQFWLTPDMARALYIAVEMLGSRKLAGIDNSEAPTKIHQALELLEVGTIDIANIAFHQKGGYLVTVNADVSVKIKEQADLYKNTFFITQDTARLLYQAVEVRHGQGSEQAKQVGKAVSAAHEVIPHKIVVALHSLGFTEVESVESGKGQERQNNTISHYLQNGYHLTTSPETIRQIRDICHGQGSTNRLAELGETTEVIRQRGSGGGGGAAAPSSPSLPATKNVMVELRHDQSADMLAPDSNIKIVAPEWVGEVLQQLGPQLTGTNIQMPDGTVKVIGESPTLIDLWFITRNESENVTGVIKTQLYTGFSRELILTLKDLIRQCQILGVVKASRYGGYPAHVNPIIQTKEQKMIVCDLIGLQFQQPENTGRLVLVSKPGKALPAGALDSTMFKALVGEDQLPYAQAAQDQQRYARVRCFGRDRLFDRKAYQAIVAADIRLYAQTVNEMADTSINLKFLRYGCGFFAGDVQQVVEANFLEGVRQGLQDFFNSGNHQNIQSIELPFTPTEAPGYGLATQKQKIIELCEAFGKTIRFTMNDALFPHPGGLMTATTNCADPHAPTGNEMQYGSVDAAIAENIEGKLDSFCPLLNSEMQIDIVSLGESAADVEPLETVIGANSGLGGGAAAHSQPVAVPVSSLAGGFSSPGIAADDARRAFASRIVDNWGPSVFSSAMPSNQQDFRSVVVQRTADPAQGEGEAEIVANSSSGGGAAASGPSSLSTRVRRPFHHTNPFSQGFEQRESSAAPSLGPNAFGD